MPRAPIVMGEEDQGTGLPGRRPRHLTTATAVHDRCELTLLVAEFQNLARILALGDEGADRPEEGIEFGRPARRQVDSEDTRVIIAEDQALPGFVAHTQKFAQVPAQLLD